ncbi:MAG: hypothetical protein H2069_04140 [Legionella sp.]|nr:hypothetical protein [Legionella sp.]
MPENLFSIYILLKGRAFLFSLGASPNQNGMKMVSALRFIIKKIFNYLLGISFTKALLYLVTSFTLKKSTVPGSIMV